MKIIISTTQKCSAMVIKIKKLHKLIAHVAQWTKIFTEMVNGVAYGSCIEEENDPGTFSISEQCAISG